MIDDELREAIREEVARTLTPALKAAIERVLDRREERLTKLLTDTSDMYTERSRVLDDNITEVIGLINQVTDLVREARTSIDRHQTTTIEETS